MDPLEDISFSKFAYQPLPVVENEIHIRLLLLQPGSGDDEICGKLIHNASTRSKRGIDYHTATTYYEALSYMWGAPDITHFILLDGKRFPVRENLWLALTRLRLEDKERTLWIDAICINQDDVEEKNVQVAQMGIVYMGSKKTLVWLGEEELGLGEPACDVISGIRGIAHSKKFWLDLVERWKVRSEGDEGDEGKGVREWYALLKLVRLEYWKRLWIMQEVVLGYAVELYWGKGILEWETIKGILTGVSDVEDDKEIGLEFQETSRALTETVMTRLIRQKYGGGKVNYFGRNDMFDLLSEYQEASCFDIRDKVYGMNGISMQQVPVDYSKTPAELCQHVLSDRFSITLKDFESRLHNTRMLRFDIFDVISGGEFVYKILLESNLRPEDAYVATSKEFESKIVVTGCNVSGHIDVVTDSLDVYRGRSQQSIKESLAPRIGPLIVSKELIMQLQYLCHLINEASAFLPSTFGNPKTNLCYTIFETSSYGQERTHDAALSPYEDWEAAKAKWGKSKDIWKKEDEERSQMTFPISSQSPEDMIASLIFATVSNLNSNALRGTKIFFANNGLIGFAPANTKQGDIICTFRESRTFLVIRTQGEKHVPVGVASSFSRDLDNDSKINLRGGTFGYDQVPERLMWLYLDIKTLQLLCSFDCEHSSNQKTLFRLKEGVRRGLNPWGNFLQP